MSSRAIWLLVWGVLWLSACHKSRQGRSKTDGTLTVTDSLASDVLADGVLFDESKANFKIQETDFEYLTAKAKFSFKNDKQDIDNATINFRVRKDSLIWFSVTTVGFEVARGQISPQELVVLDKFHKELYTYSYAELSRRFQFDLSFPLLQAVLVGNLPLPRQPGQRMYQLPDQERLLLQQPGRQVVIDNYLGESSQRLEGLRVTQQVTQNVLTLEYGDFKKLDGGYLFPFTSLLVLHARPAANQPAVQTKIGLNHSRVELTQNNPGFPFSIPSGYKKR
ncbi:DUF4292 domain-containing protein [Salmonirosea aquatica]|uniref:DUF4292 domain-containing protein n=1 Tax=Salmonirosea aquatica TaxID=2654236 RepID=A0A7C9B9U2_9BACT|nr:DUF4292 domain-containing protein [Cytophagaceae bacterium SJW1-29]